MSGEQLKLFADRDYLDLLYLQVYSLSGLDKLIERSKVVGNGLQCPRVRVDDFHRFSAPSFVATGRTAAGIE